MIDPKWGTRMEEVETDGVDIMVALDVSKSMLTEDVGMPRLDLAKRTIERLVQRWTATASDWWCLRETPMCPSSFDAGPRCRQAVPGCHHTGCHPIAGNSCGKGHLFVFGLF